MAVAPVKEALGLVREVFAEEYAAAKTSEQKASLAKKILAEGTTGTHDPTSRYALLRVARDLAAISGDAETAHGKAIDQLDRRYQSRCHRDKGGTHLGEDRRQGASAGRSQKVPPASRQSV